MPCSAVLARSDHAEFGASADPANVPPALCFQSRNAHGNRRKLFAQGRKCHLSSHGAPGFACWHARLQPALAAAALSRRGAVRRLEETPNMCAPIVSFSPTASVA